MNKYTTVRIDNDTMKKLENIVHTLQGQSLGKVSKAVAIKYVVDGEYDRIHVREKNESYLVDTNPK